MPKNSRGQAAMEFLMTYGYVILGVIGILGTLVYFDMLNPSLLLPESCELGYRLTCMDFIATANPAQMRFAVSNAFSDDMVLVGINITSQRLVQNCSQTLNNLSVTAGEQATLQVDCPGLASISEHGKVRFNTETYFFLNQSGKGNSTTSYVYPLYGSLYARIQR